MKRILFICCLFCISVVSLKAQESFTKAYQRFRPYHHQTPQAWNRIRREVAHPDKVIWSLMERDTRYLFLPTVWKKMIPVPGAVNTHFFKGEDDIGEMYNRILQPDAFGYIVYPHWIEQKFKFSEDKTIHKNILLKGFMNTVVGDIPDDIEEFLDLVVYNTDSIDEQVTEPVIYGENKALEWQLNSRNHNLCNIRNYYCYFDNRPDSMRHKVRYSTEVTNEFDDEVRNLSAALQPADLSYVMMPYWMTDLYLSLPPQQSDRIHRYGYPGYVINPVSGGIELNNNWNSPNVMDFGPYNKKPYDLVAFCGDSVSTNWFLSNRDAWKLFIYNIFEPEKGMINRPAGHKPDGLNIYFPEFDFKKKRAMKQFVKSLSLVIDSFAVDGEKPYKDLSFSLTFPRKVATTQSDYLTGLACFVDTIYYADFDSNGLTQKLIYNDGSIDTCSVWAKITNPLYLFRVPYKTIKPGINDGDLNIVADSDYSSGKWGIYFMIDIFLLITLISLIILRYFSPLINRYIQSHPTAVVLLLITLVMEIGVFFYFMLEALSPQHILFDMDKEGKVYLFMIAFPILPIAIYLAVKYLTNEKKLP